MEVVEEPPADKRACNSHDFRPSTSGGSSVQSQACGTTSGHDNTDADMDTSLSASPSSCSDGEQDREDSDYGSCEILIALCSVGSWSRVWLFSEEPNVVLSSDSSSSQQGDGTAEDDDGDTVEESGEKEEESPRRDASEEPPKDSGDIIANPSDANDQAARIDGARENAEGARAD
ncbi:hypothetical protein Bca4012_082588 [Brassica carinata]|uniref:E3 ubiquitin-protein ligase TRIP12-like TPR repeats domain-containing protein n=1 Tax=Brassica carinata TaxID=52824 RepID=A0A8X7VF63_BRACI|nr:hypothetical protein Bca52824_029618 [Brassica carinata]